MPRAFLCLPPLLAAIVAVALSLIFASYASSRADEVQREYDAWREREEAKQAETGSTAYERAKIYGTAPNAGVILWLHGCDGINEYSGSLGNWRGHLTKNGFLIVVPNSFAEPRPPAACSAPYRQKSEIYNIRARQSKRAIQELQRKYPDKKLYIWGHSEGAGVANLLDDRVDGIITSGYQCGFRSTAGTRINPDVRLLAIQGTTDRYIQESLRYTSFSSLDRLCEHVFRSQNWRRVVVQGMGHQPDARRRELKKAVNEFLGIKP